MTVVRWILALAVAALVIGGPTAYFRATYAHAKRLREVSPGNVYRCGQLTADGFREAIRRHGIRSVVNLQEEARDPLIPERWMAKPSIRESDVCKELGVRYVTLDGGVLDEPGQNPGSRPKVIDDFLAIAADPANRPILFHCKAGLHRTGLIAAVYRMEFDRWDKAAAVRELRANGFGTYAATEGNEYLKRFVLEFEPSPRAPEAGR